MRTLLNFTLATLLLLAFVGSTAFFISVSKGLKLERAAETTEAPGAS